MSTKGGHIDFMFIGPPLPGRWIRCWIYIVTFWTHPNPRSNFLTVFGKFWPKICWRSFRVNSLTVPGNTGSASVNVCKYLLPPTKDVCEGNVFTGVRLSGGFCPGGMCVMSGRGRGGDPWTVKSGQYASYWNAFLLYFLQIATNL